MRNKIIVFDLDGCLSNFHCSFSKIANSIFGTPIVRDINEVKKYRWQEWSELTSKQVSLTWDMVDKDNHFWENMEPLVEVDIFKKIEHLSCNNTLFFVTSRKHKKT